MNKKSLAKSDKLKRLITILLIIGSAMVAFKMIFFNYAVDENFHVVMSYREALGDDVFGTMWEAYATSAFLCALLIKLFITVTGSTTGIVIFLRIVGVVIHLCVSLAIYKTFTKYISKEKAGLCAVLFFNMFPKLCACPDFSNMHQWFMVLCLCLLMNAAENRFINKWQVFGAAVLYSLSILAYPSNLILAPFFLIALLFVSKEKRLQNELSFIIGCTVTGALYLIFLQCTTGLKNVFANLGNVINGDGTHLNGVNIVGENALSSVLNDLKTLLIYIAVLLVVSVIISVAIFLIRRKKNPKVCFHEIMISITIVLSFIPSLYMWYVRLRNYDSIKIYHVVITVVGIVAFFLWRKNNQEETEKRTVIVAILAGLLMFVSVCLVSNVPMLMNVVYLQTAVLFAVFSICLLFDGNKAVMWDIALLFVVFMVIGSTGFTVRDSLYGQNIMYMRSVVHEGPTKGLLVNKSEEEIIRKQTDEYLSYVKDTDSVLIISNNMNNPVTAYYMLNKAVISNYSLNATPVYNETLVEYWDQYPERLPNVIAVDKAYGQDLNFMEGTWIRNYVEGHYTLDYEADYMNFYKIK